MICASLILGLHLVSYHSNPQPYQNNINPGIYVECDGWTAGAYKNSLNRTSKYLGYTWHQGIFALSVGAVSGYKKSIGQEFCREGYTSIVSNPCVRGYGFKNIAPMVVPSVTIGLARISFIPRTKNSESNVLHLSIEKSL